jgi:hypothetical protein
MMMKATKAFDYNNRKLKVGDVFELANEHGDDAVHRHLLISAHLAEDADNSSAPGHTDLMVPPETLDDYLKNNLPDPQPKKKRTYKRRDMVAEE